MSNQNNTIISEGEKIVATLTWISSENNPVIGTLIFSPKTDSRKPYVFSYLIEGFQMRDWLHFVDERAAREYIGINYLAVTWELESQ